MVPKWDAILSGLDHCPPAAWSHPGDSLVSQKQRRPNFHNHRLGRPFSCTMLALVVSLFPVPSRGWTRYKGPRKIETKAHPTIVSSLLVKQTCCLGCIQLRGGSAFRPFAPGPGRPTWPPATRSPAADPADRIWVFVLALGVDSPFCSTIVLFKNQLFPQGFGWFFGKKDAWKEWGRYP